MFGRQDSKLKSLISRYIPDRAITAQKSADHWMNLIYNQHKDVSACLVSVQIFSGKRVFLLCHFLGCVP